MAKPLSIVPTYLRTARDLGMVETALRTLRETAGNDCDLVVVDDCSPADDLMGGLRHHCDTYDAELLVRDENGGFARAVNVGLRRAKDEGRDAVLVNADIEFTTPGWLERMVEQRCLKQEGYASVVGALLLYANGLIQHGGVHFSMLTRDFSHRFQFGPGDLPEAQVPIVCPVTGALQFIRHECLEEVGLYDEAFRLGWEDVDYDVRVWLSGRESVYQPAIQAIHHESAFRGNVTERIARWTEESWRTFCTKWPDQSFLEFVPSLTLGTGLGVQSIEIARKHA